MPGKFPKFKSLNLLLGRGESAFHVPQPQLRVSDPATALQATPLAQGSSSEEPAVKDAQVSRETHSKTNSEAEGLLFSQLWVEASENLSDEEKRTLCSKEIQHLDSKSLPTIVIKAVYDKKSLCEKKGWHFPALGKALEWLDKVKAAGDIAVNVDPVHAGLPWAGIRLVLELVQSERNQMEALSRGLSRVSYILYRCRLYEVLLHETSAPAPRLHLRSTLVNFYTAILKFLIQALRIYGHSSLRRAFTIWRADEIKEFEINCQEYETHAEAAAQSCERSESSKARKTLLELPRMKDLKGLFDHLDETVSAVWSQLQEDEMGEVLMWVSQIPYEDDHKFARRGRTDQTGDWVFEQQKYQQWRSDNGSRILWLHGIPGAGKTKLVSRIIDQMTDQERGNGLAYFYCNQHDPSRGIPTNILQSYIKQLSRSPTDGAIQQILVDVYKENKRKGKPSTTFDLEECEKLFTKLVEAYTSTTVILDALDECPWESQGCLIQSLSRLVINSSNLKVLISSRRDDAIKRWLEKEINFVIEAKDNREDIRKFVEAKIKDMGHYRREPISTGLQAEIVETILLKSQGMFQWAALQIDDILRIPFESRIRDRLGRLPQNLEKAYDEILNRINARNDGYPEIADRAFQWIFFAFEPLQPEALVKFVSQDTKIAELTIHDLLDACCNLVVVDETCRFSHLSVREYLQEHHYNAQRSLTDDFGHASLAMRAISCIIETNDVDIKAQTKFDETDQQISPPYRSLRQWPRPRQRQQQQQSLQPVLPSLQYAAEFWHQHTAELFGSGIPDKLKVLITKIFSPDFIQAYFNWLRIHDCDVLRTTLASRKAAEDFPSPLYYASLLGFDFVVEILLSQGTKASRVDKRFESAAVAAGLRCHTRTLGLLLQSMPKSDQEDEICRILEELDENEAETVSYLRDSGVLHDTPETDEGCQTSKSTIQGKFAEAAAKNVRGQGRVIDKFIDLCGDSVSITEETAKAAAANYSYGDKVMQVLLEKLSHHVPITDEVVKVAAKNRGCGDKVLLILLEKRGHHIPITDEVIEAAAQNYQCGDRLLSILLERSDYEFAIKPSLLQVAARNGGCGDRLLSILLERSDKKLALSDIVLEAAAQNLGCGDKLICLLLEGIGKEFPINASLLEAAAGNATYGVEVIQFLFDNFENVTITGHAIKEFMDNYGGEHEMLSVILERRQKQIAISIALVQLAREDPEYGRAISPLLLDIPGPIIPIAVIKTILLTTKISKTRLMEKVPGTQEPYTITDDLVKEIATAYSKDRVMTDLLYKFGTRLWFTEDAIAEVARSFNPRVMMILLHKQKIQQKMKVTLTEKMVEAAAQNEYHHGMTQTLLCLCQRPDHG